MRGETFLGIVENEDGKPADWNASFSCVIWSTVYVLTSAGAYQCDGDEFVRVHTLPEGETAGPLGDAIGQIIRDVRRDEENNILILLGSGGGVTIFRSALADYSGPVFGNGYGYLQSVSPGDLRDFPAAMATRREGGSRAPHSVP